MQRPTATMKIKQQPKTTKDATTDAAARSGFRKGPWTEQEDMKLVWFVRRLFGERRWDLLAKVSGLNRTGKSCRLRWVNYLHPDLKRGRMTPDEERRVADLHATFGNRWSRIAKSMPGRTDNEIKNYWRTHMRKQHAGKRTSTTAAADDSASTSSTSASSSTAAAASPATTSSNSSSSNNSDVNQGAATRGAEEDDQEAAPCSQEQILYTAGEAMDQLLIWNDIDWSSTIAGMAAAAPLMPSSPVWDYCSGSLWE